MDGRFAGLTGSATTDDLETALQAVHLYFTQPRRDSLLFTNILGNSRSALEGRYANPVNAFSDTIAYVMGNYAYRNSPPWPEKLDRITLDKVFSIYRQRFADASGFTFVFVGRFSVDSLLPLLAEYLGTLPSLYKKEQARDLGIHIPSGKMDKTVYGGNEDKATVRLVYSGDYRYSPLANMQLQALGQILQIKLLQHLREDEGEVYSPQVQTIYNKFPKNRYALVVTFGCAPRNADLLSAMVQQEMDSLRLRGPLPEDVLKYKVAYTKNLELALKDNGFWLGYLAGQLENRDPLSEVLDNQLNLEKVAGDNLRKAAQSFLDGRNLIRFMLLPEREEVKPGKALEPGAIVAPS
jgi:zinc protease